MADKTKILELDIDVESIISKSAELKSTLDGLRAEQNEFKKSGDTSSEAYVKLEATIKKVSAEYNTNQKQLSNLAQVNSSFLTIQQKLTLAMDKENTSIDAALENNAELLKIRNALNLANEEEAKLKDEINAKIDANNKFIKENVSELEQQKIGIGDYKTAITEAIEESGIFGGALGDVKQGFEIVSKVAKPFKEDVMATVTSMRNAGAETEGLSTGQKALTITTNLLTGSVKLFTLALAATGIMIIVGAVLLFIGYLKSLDPVMDKVETGLAAIGGVIDFLEEKIGSFIEGIESAGDALNKLGNFIAHPIDSLKSLGNEMANAAKEAANLKEREQELGDQMNINSILNKKQESEIARLLIQAKDRSKSQSEQNKLFADAEKLNQDIFERNKKVADEDLSISIEIAKKKKKLTEDEIQSLKDLDIAKATAFLNDGKITIEAYERLQDSFNKKIEVENQYNEQLDKITTKSNNALEKQQAANEAAAKKAEEMRQKALDDAARLVKAELDLYISQQGARAKSMEEQIKMSEEIFKRKMEIAKKEFEASKKTEADKLQLLINENNAKNELLQKQSDIVIANASRELQIFLDNNKTKLEQNKFLTDEMVAQELERINRISEAEAEYQTQRLLNGKISQEEYAAEIRAIDEKVQAEKDVLEEEKKQADAEKKAIDLENKYLADQELADNEFAKQQFELDRQKEAEVLAAEKSGADINLINQKYTTLKKNLDKSITDFKLGQELAIIQGLRGLLGEQTALGKGLALAETFFTTIKNANAAFTQAAVFAANPLTAPLAVNANIQGGIIVASGAMQAAKISGVKLAKGVIDLQGPGTTTSDSIPAMLSRGETVTPADKTAKYRPLLEFIHNDSNVDFGTQSFPASTLVKTYNQGGQSQTIDYDLLASKIGDNVAQANLLLPPPRLALDEFNQAQGNYADVVNGADHG